MQPFSCCTRDEEFVARKTAANRNDVGLKPDLPVTTIARLLGRSP
jgi:hypothetical protein